MEIHDLLVLLQHEVQKSLSFIDETRGVKDPEIPAIHISLESVEIELPIVMSEVDLIWDPQQLKGTPYYRQGNQNETLSSQQGNLKKSISP